MEFSEIKELEGLIINVEKVNMLNNNYKKD